MMCAEYWAPDASASACTQCHRSFSLFLRRHHCRHCGGIFCSRCSTRRLWLRPLDSSSPRVSRAGRRSRKIQTRARESASDGEGIVRLVELPDTAAMVCGPRPGSPACSSSTAGASDAASLASPVATVVGAGEGPPRHVDPSAPPPLQATPRPLPSLPPPQQQQQLAREAVTAGPAPHTEPVDAGTPATDPCRTESADPAGATADSGFHPLLTTRAAQSSPDGCVDRPDPSAALDAYTGGATEGSVRGRHVARSEGDWERVSERTRRGLDGLVWFECRVCDGCFANLTTPMEEAAAHPHRRAPAVSVHVTAREESTAAPTSQTAPAHAGAPHRAMESSDPPSPLLSTAGATPVGPHPLLSPSSASGTSLPASVSPSTAAGECAPPSAPPPPSQRSVDSAKADPPQTAGSPLLPDSPEPGRWPGGVGHGIAPPPQQPPRVRTPASLSRLGTLGWPGVRAQRSGSISSGLGSEEDVGGGGGGGGGEGGSRAHGRGPHRALDSGTTWDDSDKSFAASVSVTLSQPVLPTGAGHQQQQPRLGVPTQRIRVGSAAALQRLAALGGKERRVCVLLIDERGYRGPLLRQGQAGPPSPVSPAASVASTTGIPPASVPLADVFLSPYLPMEVAPMKDPGGRLRADLTLLALCEELERAAPRLAPPRLPSGPMARPASRTPPTVTTTTTTERTASSAGTGVAVSSSVSRMASFSRASTPTISPALRPGDSAAAGPCRVLPRPAPLAPTHLSTPNVHAESFSSSTSSLGGAAGEGVSEAGSRARGVAGSAAITGVHGAVTVHDGRGRPVRVAVPPPGVVRRAITACVPISCRTTATSPAASTTTRASGHTTRSTVSVPSPTPTNSTTCGSNAPRARAGVGAVAPARTAAIPDTTPTQGETVRATRPHHHHDHPHEEVALRLPVQLVGLALHRETGAVMTPWPAHDSPALLPHGHPPRGLMGGMGEARDGSGVGMGEAVGYGSSGLAGGAVGTAATQFLAATAVHLALTALGPPLRLASVGVDAYVVVVLRQAAQPPSTDVAATATSGSTPAAHLPSLAAECPFGSQQLHALLGLIASCGGAMPPVTILDVCHAADRAGGAPATPATLTAAGGDRGSMTEAGRPLGSPKPSPLGRASAALRSTMQGLQSAAAALRVNYVAGSYSAAAGDAEGSSEEGSGPGHGSEASPHAQPMMQQALEVALSSVLMKDYHASYHRA